MVLNKTCHILSNLQIIPFLEDHVVKKDKQLFDSLIVMLLSYFHVPDSFHSFYRRCMYESMSCTTEYFDFVKCLSEMSW